MTHFLRLQLHVCSSVALLLLFGKCLGKPSAPQEDVVEIKSREEIDSYCVHVQWVRFVFVCFKLSHFPLPILFSSYVAIDAGIDHRLCVW